MRWKQDKSDPKSSRSPFLVLPKIETLYAEKTPLKSEMPVSKNPGLRLFTKTWRPQKEIEEEHERPLTATLERPQILDVELATKIDMSLIRKEFLCIANLCRVPLNTLTVTRAKRKTCSNPTPNRQYRAPNRPLSLPGGKIQLKKSSRRPCTSEDSWEEDRSSSSHTCSSLSSKKSSSKMNKVKPPKTSIPQKLATTTGDNDANNNRHRTDISGFKTYRIPHSRNRTVRVSTVEKPEIAAVNSNRLPQPCKTCGRIDQPERFHSHPETPPVVPRKMSEKTAVIKNSVQKPVAIKYKSKLTEKRKVVASAAPVKKSAENIVEIRKNGVENCRKTVSAKGPRTLTCYICGREFGTMSLPLHEPKCLEKWDRENINLPPQLQRKRPIKPDRPLTKEEWNTFAWESSQANLVPCLNCRRTFFPDRLVVHQRSCKPKDQHPLTMAKFSKEEPIDTRPVTSAKPRSVACSVCGKLFGTKSIKFHEPQCLKKWHLQNDHLPPSEREPMYRKPETPEVPEEVAPPPPPEPQRTQSSTSTKKPPMFPCYLCGRLFSVNSIYIHEPQCLKKWRIENDKLPPHKRRQEPLKPDIKFTPSGGVDFVGTFHRIWDNHLAELVQCKRCGRRFFPDRIEKHQAVCTGLSINDKNRKK